MSEDDFESVIHIPYRAPDIRWEWAQALPTELIREFAPRGGEPLEIELWQSSAGLDHRDAGPAIILRDTETGEIRHESWRQNGRPHRTGAPAIVAQTRNMKLESWFTEGMQHREAAPAVTLTAEKPEGAVMLLEAWYSCGKRDRREGPAITLRDQETGKVRMFAWWLQNRLHREDGPAIVIHNDDETVEEMWYLEGKRHREEGPACILRPSGSSEILASAWFQNGVELNGPSYWTDEAAPPIEPQP